MTKRAGRRWQGHQAAKRLHSLAAGCADALVQHELLSRLKMLASASISNISFSNTASASITDAPSNSLSNAASTSIADAASASIPNSTSILSASVKLPTPAPPTMLAFAAKADAANAAAAADLHMPAPPTMLAFAAKADSLNASSAADVALVHISRCRRFTLLTSTWSPYH